MSIENKRRIKYTNGQQVGKMIFVKELESLTKTKRRRAIFRCICGCEIDSRVSHVVHNKIVSCGCEKMKRISTLNLSHGHCKNFSRTSEYHCWAKMIQRCENKNDPQYGIYGLRGILVCERWHQFENFLVDMNLKPGKTYSIDRINNNGNYEPDNCRWATKQEQNRNTRRNKNYEFMGQIKKLPEWAEVLSIPRGTLQTRIDRGWSINRAFSK